MIPIPAIIIIALGVLICAYLIIRLWVDENKTNLVGMEENKMKKELVWTNEDAIKMLKSKMYDDVIKILKSKMDGSVDTSYEWTETVRLAIKALEQEPVLDKIKAEIKEWYWQADKQALAKDPCVVDAMIDLFIRTINKYKSESEV